MSFNSLVSIENNDDLNVSVKLTNFGQIPVCFDSVASAPTIFLDNDNDQVSGNEIPVTLTQSLTNCEN